MNITMALNYMSFSRPAAMPFSPLGQTPTMSQAAIQPLGSPNAPDSQRVFGQPDYDTYECQTCKNRKYQDGSNDPGVSFKTPTHLDPERAAYAIRSHEMEHVAHAKADAAKDEDKEILSQSVTYHTAICPECGRVYMSGGTTRTTFRTSREVAPEPVETGKFLDQVA